MHSIDTRKEVACICPLTAFSESDIHLKPRFKTPGLYFRKTSCFLDSISRILDRKEIETEQANDKTTSTNSGLTPSVLVQQQMELMNQQIALLQKLRTN